ncbi:sel1 repeat family protein [Olsenella sp. oral taxon 807]|uniref:sel1 repeat family protein n=1 Tax=Olsenella sp. oral taxon 807 TaxID=712411 RepID=UPI0009FB675D
MYESGKGVERNIPMARHWYGLATSQGNARAQGALRSMRPKSGRSPRAPSNRPPLCPLPRQCQSWPKGRSRPVSWTRRSSSS